MALAFLLPTACGGGPTPVAKTAGTSVAHQARSAQPTLTLIAPAQRRADRARIARPDTERRIVLRRPPPRVSIPDPRQLTPKRPLQCVPYARARSRIEIRGDAWTWWRTAAGRYQRGRLPAVGSVLVLQRRGKSRGHLAYVKHVVSDREIVVDHANWLNRGRIHENARVRDISANNDWSRVNVWYTPGRHYGKAVYRPYGFIYPLKARSARGTISRRGPPTGNAGAS